MNQWANSHPEEMAEIAALPLNQQNAALQAAIGYDPDRIRDEAEEHSCHVTGDRPTSPPGVAATTASLSGTSSPGGGGNCEACGAPVDVPHAHWCDLRGQK